MATTLPYNFAVCWDRMYKGQDERGPFYEVTYLFDDWSQSDAVVNALLGANKRLGSTTLYQTPHQFPLSPNLWCSSARATGASPPILSAGGLPNYTGKFTVEATYRAAAWGGIDYDPLNMNAIDPTDTVLPQLWCTQELDTYEEIYTLPNTQYQYVASGKLTGIPHKRTIGHLVMKLTFHKVPFMPMGPINAFLWKVNSAPLLGAAAGFIRLKNTRTSREIQPDSTVAQNLYLEFVQRQIPWNAVPLKTGMGFDFVQDAAGNQQYLTAPLGNLFAALL